MQGPQPNADRGFWLAVQTELVVSGITEPDAKVTIQGISIPVRPDGTFTVRFELPDGEQIVPVIAVSRDGMFEKEITPRVTRSTTKSERILDEVEPGAGDDEPEASAQDEDGEDEPTGASAIVTDQSGEMVAELAGGDGITKQAQRDWPRLSATTGRFVVTLVVDRAGLPEPLGTEAFVIPSSVSRPDPRHPVVHLQRMEGLDESPSEVTLLAEMLLPSRGPLTLLEARDAVLSTLRAQLPFLDRHVRVIDSPHDGLPLIDRSTGSEREIDRIHLAEGTPGAEPMRWQWSVEPSGYLDIAGEPIRGPIPGTFLVGRTVLPGLGQEGELIAAWGAARLITRRDRTRQKMRRQMWTKIET